MSLMQATEKTRQEEYHREEFSGPATSFEMYAPSAVGPPVLKRFARGVFLPNGTHMALSTYGAPFAVLSLRLRAISWCAVISSFSSGCVSTSVT